MTYDGTPPRPLNPAHPTLLDAHLKHFTRRVLQDALAEATATYWRHRATTFDAVGTPSSDLIALNCRRHANLLIELGLDAETRALIDHQLAQSGAA